METKVGIIPLELPKFFYDNNVMRFHNKKVEMGANIEWGESPTYL